MVVSRKNTHSLCSSLLQLRAQIRCPQPDLRITGFAQNLRDLDAREHGCPWDEWTCHAAASNGHMEVVKWARERDCPWDEHTLQGGLWNRASGGR